MKNENLINVILVIAIVLAVGGTWLNLNKLSEVKKVTLTGYAVGGLTPVDYAVTVNALMLSGPTATTNTEGSSETAGETIDCWWSTDGTDPTVGAEPFQCNMSSTNATNASFYNNANKAINGSAYMLQTVTAQFGAGTLNHNYVKLISCTNGTLNQVNGGAISSNGTWITADTKTSGDQIRYVTNANNESIKEFNCTLAFGQKVDVSTPPGTYSNTLYWRLHTGS